MIEMFLGNKNEPHIGSYVKAGKFLEKELSIKMPSCYFETFE